MQIHSPGIVAKIGIWLNLKSDDVLPNGTLTDKWCVLGQHTKLPDNPKLNPFCWYLTFEAVVSVPDLLMAIPRKPDGTTDEYRVVLYDFVAGTVLLMDRGDDTIIRMKPKEFTARKPNASDVMGTFDSNDAVSF